MGYLRPRSIEEAVSALAARPWTVLAGGTDHYPARVGPRADEDIVDISALADLRGVRADDGGWRIGALTTWSEVARADLPPLFDGLKLAAREVGGAQIQNRGTVGGNLCNASPAADGVPPLLTLDATVEIRAFLFPQAGPQQVASADRKTMDRRDVADRMVESEKK